MRRLKVLFILLAVSCACFAVVMLYPPSLSLLATKNVMIVQKQFTRTVTQAQKPRFQDKSEESNITIQTNLSDFQKPRFQDKYVESNITIQTNLSDFQKPRFQDKNEESNITIQANPSDFQKPRFQDKYVDSNITIQANLSDFQKPRFQDKYEESNITSKTNLSIYTVYKRTIKNQQWVIINGWHLRNLYKNRIYLCCLLSQSKKTRIETVSKRKTFGSPTDGRLAFQHQCKLENISDNDEIIAATLVWRKNGSRTDFRHKYNALCPKNKDQYRLFDHVVVPEDIGDSRIFANLSGRNITSLNQNGSDFNLAICAKLAYGNLDVNLTIEWMEYHRKLGVSKVVLYQHESLSSTARAVLQHYQKLGFLEVVPFDIPMTDQVKSYISVNVHQAWQDEQVAVYDCQERLFRYKYIGVTDIDEFIVPYAYTTLQEVIEKLENANPIAGAFRFFTDLHVTEWNASRNDETIVGSYLDWTNDTRNDHKQLFRSDLMEPGGVKTHWIIDLFKPYKEIYVPKQIVRLLHYRQCRPEWKKETCLSMNRTEDMRILSYMDESLRTSIKKTKELFS